MELREVLWSACEERIGTRTKTPSLLAEYQRTGSALVAPHKTIRRFGPYHSSIEIRLPSATLKFANLEELKQCQELPLRVTKFRIWLSQNERCVRIYSPMRLGSRATVSATADTTAWCAGAVDEVFSFVQSYKLWYSWFLSIPVFLALNLVAIAPTMANISTGFHPERLHPLFAEHPVVFNFGWPGAAYALLLLYFANERLLPSAVIRTSDSEGFVRKHAAELGVAIMLISAILTVIGWFVQK
jgi:hypothetical protein